MGRDLVKKIVIGTAIALAASAPLLGQEKKPSPPVAKVEKQIVLEDKKTRDPFVPPKNIRYLAKQSEIIINSLDDLAHRLKKDGFDKKQILAAYDDERFKIHPHIANYFVFNPEEQTPTYEEYKKHIGLNRKIKAGVMFFERYSLDLLLAEDYHGVEASIGAAILGVESDFGQNLGQFRAFNAAVSLYSSPRKEFAYRQLKSLLNLSKENNLDFMEVFSSYALCAFPGQFLLENIPVFFVGGNGDPKGDLFSMVDWIYSIDNYLEKAGWDHRQNYKPIKKGSANWKAIWAYNHSEYYVWAIIELASAIRDNPEVKIRRDHHEEFKKMGKILVDIW